MGSYECGRSCWCCLECWAWLFALSPGLAWNIGASRGVTMFDPFLLFTFGVLVQKEFCWVAFSSGIISSLSSFFVGCFGVDFASGLLLSTAVAVLLSLEFVSLPTTPVHSEAWFSNICQAKDSWHKGHTPKPLPPLCERKLVPETGRGLFFPEDCLTFALSSFVPPPKYEVSRFCLLLWFDPNMVAVQFDWWSIGERLQCKTFVDEQIKKKNDRLHICFSIRLGVKSHLPKR